MITDDLLDMASLVDPKKQSHDGDVGSNLQAPDADSETNPLAWWKINVTSFLRVNCPAKRYLYIPATSTPSEHVLAQVATLFDAVGRL